MIMDIKHLLDKFYAGTSTPEEELLLKDYFLTEDIDDSLKADQLLFNALYSETIEVPAEVSERLDKAIDHMGESSRALKPKRQLIPYWVSSAAAIILLCIGFFWITQQSVEPQIADTFDDPTEAAIAAEKALAFMSSQLNKGLNQVADARQEFEKVDQILNKHLK